MFRRVLSAAVASSAAYCVLLLLIYLGKPGDKSGLGFVLILLAFWGVGIAAAFMLLFWFIFDARERRKRAARSSRVETAAVIYGIVLLACLAWLARAI